MMSGHVAMVVVLALSGILIPRALGAEAYGRYAAVLAVVAMLQGASTLGLQQVGVRFLSPLWRAPDPSDALVLGSTIWTLRLALTPLIGLAGVFWLGGTIASQEQLGVRVALGLLCALRPAQEAALGLFLPVGHVGKLVGFELLQVLMRLPVVLVCYRAFGLAGVFVALAVLQGMIWVTTARVLRRVFPVRLVLFRLHVLKPYVSYGFSSWFMALCGILQTQFAIYAVADWVSTREAGHLAVGMNLYGLFRGAYMPAVRSLMPILAEMESAGETERLRRWCSLILRCGVAGASGAVVAWAAFGESFLRLIFGHEFTSVYPVVTVLLASLTFLAGALTCHALLFVQSRMAAASFTTALHTAATLGGLAFVLARGDATGAPMRIAWVHFVASALFFVGTYVSVVRREGLRLPLAASLALSLPALLAVPIASWQAGWSSRLLVLVALTGLYGLVTTRLGLLPVRELAEIVATLRRRPAFDGEGDPEDQASPRAADRSRFS